MSEPYVAQIMIFAFNFAPRNWSFCNGALVPISQNEALFSLVGTTYGGNGTTTFGLPNLQDRTVVNIGQGPGLSNYDLGQTVGTDTVTLAQTQLPGHLHTLTGETSNGTLSLLPTANGWFGAAAGPPKMFSSVTPTSVMATSELMTAGGSQPHMNEQPYLGMNYCIALYGIFPSRN